MYRIFVNIWTPSCCVQIGMDQQMLINSVNSLLFYSVTALEAYCVVALSLLKTKKKKNCKKTNKTGHQTEAQPREG